MRLIDADALMAEMHNIILEDGEDRRTFYEVIERQPTIEPERRRGKWEACFDCPYANGCPYISSVIPDDCPLSVEPERKTGNQLPPAQPEIIRCKDCEYWDKTWTNDWAEGYHYCPNVDGVRKVDFYCADAERREE